MNDIAGRLHEIVAAGELRAHDEIRQLRKEVNRLSDEGVAFKTVLYAEIPGLTIVRREDGSLAAITITDDDHQIQRILWE